MLKRFLVLAAFLACSAQAADSSKVSVIFDSIRLSDFARLVFSEILQEGFLLGPDFLNDSTTVSVNLKYVERSALAKTLERFLSENGYTVVMESGVSRVVKTDKLTREIYVYRPKYRSASFLMGVVGALFPQGSFTTQRRMSSGAASGFGSRGFNQAPGGGYQGGNMQSGYQGQPGQDSMPFDSGTSAYSMLDKDVDVVVFQGSAKDVKQLEKLLAQVDTAQGEVLVKAMVFEVTESEKEGTAVGVALNLLSGKLGIQLSDVTKNLGNAVTVKSTDFNAIYSALSSDSRFKVVSSPSVRVKSGDQARFSSGADVPVLGAIQMDKNGNPIQSIDYKPSGVIFSLQPTIREEEIEVSLNQQLSSFIPTTTGVNNSPTLLKRELSTNVSAKPDDYILLGGLDEDRTTDESSGLWFLPSWLHNKAHDRSKSQILLVVNVQKI